MKTVLNDLELASVVRAARAGDPAAWAELVARFQDVAVPFRGTEPFSSTPGEWTPLGEVPGGVEGILGGASD